MWVWSTEPLQLPLTSSSSQTNPHQGTYVADWDWIWISWTPQDCIRAQTHHLLVVDEQGWFTPVQHLVRKCKENSQGIIWSEAIGRPPTAHGQHALVCLVLNYFRPSLSLWLVLDDSSRLSVLQFLCFLLFNNGIDVVLWTNVLSVYKTVIRSNTVTNPYSDVMPWSEVNPTAFGIVLHV